MFIAATRGLVDTDGYFWFTLTPLNEPWILDDAGTGRANPGIYTITASATHDTLGFSDQPGVGSNAGFWDAVEFWFNATTSLYHSRLGNASDTYESPTNPPPVPGSTIEWGFHLECPFGSGCRTARGYWPARGCR